MLKSGAEKCVKVEFYSVAVAPYKSFPHSLSLCVDKGPFFIQQMDLVLMRCVGHIESSALRQII